MASKGQKVRGVFERPEGSGIWWINYYVRGKQHREKVGRKSDALALYQKRKADARRNIKLPELRASKVVTISDLVDLAIEYTVHHKDSRNYHSRGEIVRTELGHRAAGDITPQELDQWLTRHCTTAATFNRYRAFLSLCFKQAMANGKVQSNPARLVRQRKEENARLRFLSREEYDRLCNAIRESYPDQLPAFVVSVNTGMRLTEQYTIEWNQVDLKRRTIRLNKTKNGSSRTVHLNSDALAVLTPLQDKGHKATDRVFPSDTSDFKTSEWFGECLKAAAITGYTWHCNRHTACSWLAMAGGTMKEIQEMGGFKTIVMAARYAHLSPDHRLSIVERISSQYAKEQAALQGQQ
jgi:integrase